MWHTIGARFTDVCAAAIAPLYPAYKNPGISVTREEAAASMRQMSTNQKPVVRPVLILNGYHGYAGLAYSQRDALAAHTSRKQSDFLPVSYVTATDIQDSAARVLIAVQERWGDEVGRLPELDVLGISMGGLVARLCSMPPEARAKLPGSAFRQGSRSGSMPPVSLNIARLFTFATPHRGAILADRVSPDDAARSMRTDAAFIAGLNTSEAMREANISEMICYTQLRDSLVGARNTAPPGMHPCWVDGPAWFAHFTASRNPIVFADVARQLRGEARLVSAAAHSEPPRM